MDTINFSFWPNAGEKYNVSYNGTTYTGYFAACAALNKVAFVINFNHGCRLLTLVLMR